jgi:hypothetical protein
LLRETGEALQALQRVDAHVQAFFDDRGRDVVVFTTECIILSGVVGTIDFVPGSFGG